MNLLLKTDNLYVGYKVNYPLIKNLNIQILEGESIVLQGSNGSGKTTLIKTLCGLHMPLKGKVQKSYNCTVSQVPQMKNIALEFPMTIKDALFLYRNSFWTKKTLTPEEEYILEKTKVKEYWNLLLRECSGGQLQRFLIARSLLSGANLIFLDEPLDALDPEGQESIFHLFQEWKDKKKISIFLITHNLDEEWKSWFQKSYWIRSGELLERDFKAI